MDKHIVYSQPKTPPFQNVTGGFCPLKRPQLADEPEGYQVVAVWTDRHDSIFLEFPGKVRSGVVEIYEIVNSAV